MMEDNDGNDSIDVDITEIEERSFDLTEDGIDETIASYADDAARLKSYQLYLRGES
jgi:hypothetical protein